jgi:hypothetical protein
MQGKFKWTNKVVTCKIIYILFIVNVINLNFVELTNLKIILDIKLLYPLWAQAVHYDFCCANFCPIILNLFEENRHSIGPSKSIQVRQVNALKWQPDCVYQTLHATFNAFIEWGQNCIIDIISTALEGVCNCLSILMLSEAWHCVS